MLKGEKKLIHMKELKPIRVNDKRYITVKRVVQQIKNNRVFMKYLPEKPAFAGRAFLFNVVNTLDPDYFRVAQGEIDRLRLAKVPVVEEAVVEICPEMQKLLSSFAPMSADRKTRPMSLAMLKMGAKKRQKVDRSPAPELKTRIKQLK